MLLMVTDEEIKEWMKKRYPEYADNIELGRLLWKKMKARGIQVSEGIEKKNIGDIVEGDYCRIEGVVTDARINWYMGCKVCFKKECSCVVEKVRHYRHQFEVADKTGRITVAYYIGLLEDFMDKGKAHCYLSPHQNSSGMDL